MNKNATVLINQAAILFCEVCAHFKIITISSD